MPTRYYTEQAARILADLAAKLGVRLRLEGHDLMPALELLERELDLAACRSLAERVRSKYGNLGPVVLDACETERALIAAYARKKGHEALAREIEEDAHLRPPPPHVREHDERTCINCRVLSEAELARNERAREAERAAPTVHRDRKP